MSKIIATALLFISMLAEASSPIVIVYVDHATEKKYGDFPISRTLYAKAIATLARSNPKAIVIKIFLDMPRPEDKELIVELKKHKNVYTQAMAINEDVPWKGEIPLKSLGKNKHGLEDLNSGWIPGKEIVEAFKGVGMVVSSENKKGEVDGFYVVNSIQGEVYPSLPLLLAADHKNETISYLGSTVTIGKSIIKLAANGSIPPPPLPAVLPWKNFSFLDLLEDKIKSEEFKDKIVFIYYTGKKAPPKAMFKGGRMLNQAEGVALFTDVLLAQLMQSK